MPKLLKEEIAEANEERKLTEEEEQLILYFHGMSDEPIDCLDCDFDCSWDPCERHEAMIRRVLDELNLYKYFYLEPFLKL